MSTYGAMIARIADETNWPQLANRIPKAILSAITFYESERFWFTEGESTTSTVASQQAYAVPTDFLESDSLTITRDSIRYPLKRRPWAWMRDHNIDTTVTSFPGNWAYYSDQLYLYPVPDAVYTLTMSYLLRLTALSATSSTNAWMTHGEELIRERAKYDLAKMAGDYDAAAAFRTAERDAFKNLRAKSEQKISTAVLSLDSALVRGGDRYNINYE